MANESTTRSESERENSLRNDGARGIDDAPFLARQVVRLTGVCARRPVVCFSVAVATSFAALFFALCYLQFKPSDFRLRVNAKSRAARLSEEFLSEVADPVESCVVVEPKDMSATLDDVEKALKEVCSALNERPELFTVDSRGLDGESFKKNRLFFLSPEEYEEARTTAEIARAMERGDWFMFSVDAIARKLTEQVDESLKNERDSLSVVDSVLVFSRSFFGALTAKSLSPETTPSAVAPGIESRAPERLSPTPYYSFHTKNALGGGVVFNFNDELSREELMRAVDLVNLFARRVQASNPRTLVETTGIPFIERREYESLRRAWSAYAVFFVASVVVFFWAFFGAASRPLIVLTSLFVGGGWTIGFLTLVYRSFSPGNVDYWPCVICATILFNAVYFARYASYRQVERSAREALTKTAATSGYALTYFVIVVCVVSAIYACANASCRTFCVMSCAGMAFNCLASLVVLPSTLQLFDGSRPFRKQPVSLFSGLEREQTASYLRVASALAVLFVAALCFGIPRVKIDPTRAAFHSLGFSHLDAEERASQYLESRAIYGVLFADSLEDARRIASELRSEDENGDVFYVENVADSIPTPTPDDVARVEAIGDALKSLKPEIGEIPVASREELVAALEALRSAAEGAFRSPNANLEISEYLASALKKIATLSDDELARRVEAYSRLVAYGELKRLRALADESSASAPCADDLSETLKERCVGRKSGRIIIRVYSLRTLSRAANLLNFVRALREVDPNATGPAVLAYEQGVQRVTGGFGFRFLLIGVFAFLAYMRFRSLRAIAAVVLTPLIAFAGTIGAAGLFNIELNPFNQILTSVVVFSSIFFGLRFAADYDEDPERFVSKEYVVSSCVVAATLAGIYSYGFTLPEVGWQNFARLGILSALICAVVSTLVLPTALNWSAIRRRENATDGAESGAPRES